MALQRRSLILSAFLALALSACGQGDATVGGSGGGGAVGKFERPGDMAIGSPDAPVTLIEYASITCPHCADWHRDVWPVIESQYIDTGKVRFVFREFPTNPPELAAGAFLVARCGEATPEQYFARLGTMFERQQQIFEAYGRGAARDELLRLASTSGVSERQFAACVADQAGYERINKTVENAIEEFKITGTPSFILNGEVVKDPGIQTPEGARAILDRALSGAR